MKQLSTLCYRFCIPADDTADLSARRLRLVFSCVALTAYLAS